MIDSAHSPIHQLSTARSRDAALPKNRGWNSTTLSPDGRWMSYRYDRLEGEDTLSVRELDGESLHVVPRGASPAFSRDSQWMVKGVEFLGKEFANPRVMMDGSLWGKVEKEEEGQ